MISIVSIMGTPSFLNAADEIPTAASVGGVYSNLIQVTTCPNDKEIYGEFRDYGYWRGGVWCGQTARAGYWVWVSPRWYVWENKKAPLQATARNAH
ncbi:MAG: hypothetical protein JW884_02925 [Deltaproteobacteria bacterium]|nr:hypothetical protein [Deltaproteobacteria bacterium]